MATQTATFAAGCFWGVEAAFRQVPGVIDVISGYTGGRVDNPTYRQVCGHATGHAEAVEVRFDPQQVDYETLLNVFWKIHDPTQLNRQGPDVGDQYRSAIFTHGEEQERAAIAAREREQRDRARPIVTQILPAPRFWPAEDYHQRYFEKNGGAACHVFPGAAR
jgi:peptide-methionine (S)-S-oxide reductase